MSKRSHRPRRNVASKSRIESVHLRDPAGNERSVCNAEERATYSGDNVICTVDAKYVTCPACAKWIKEEKKHLCVRVYNGGQRESEEVKGDAAVSRWTVYNFRNRPGVALFVDGVCCQYGYLSIERCREIAKELKRNEELLKGGAP